MNHLISIRTNIMYSKDSKTGEYHKFHELIFLVDKPTYKLTNGREVVRERSVEEQRFMVSEEAFSAMMELLSDIKKASEKDLEP